jgi:hypothetical protein
MLRRDVLLRKEYLLRKQLEEKQAVLLEKKRRLKDAVDNSKPIPTDLTVSYDFIFPSPGFRQMALTLNYVKLFTWRMNVPGSLSHTLMTSTSF